MLTRGKLAQMTGCNGETIRYYEGIGLLEPPKRADNGYRVYTSAHVERLGFIRRAKELGFTIDAIRILLGISDNAAGYTRAEIKQLTEGHIADITQKIRDLEDLRKTLTEIVGQCDGARESADECPIVRSIYEN